MSRFTCSANRIAQSDNDVNAHIQNLPSSRIASRRAVMPPGATVALTVRPCAQLFLVESGALKVSLPSGLWTLRPQDAMWMPAFIFYQLEADTEVALYAVSFPRRFCAAHFPAEARMTCVSPLLRELVRHLAKAPADYDEAGHFGRVSSLIPKALDWQPVPCIPVPHLENAQLQRLQQALQADPSDRRKL